MRKVLIARSAEEMRKLRPEWENVNGLGRGTIFQNYSWNELAATFFAERQPPLVAMAESDSGVAIIPAAIDIAKRELVLMGETLFDYRDALWAGDESLLDDAWSAVLPIAIEQKLGFDSVALRGEELPGAHASETVAWSGFKLKPFTQAPSVCRWDSGRAVHSRLARNMRRLLRAGCERKGYLGDASELVRRVYKLKAREENSLFHDPVRIAIIAAMAQADPYACEIFTLEEGGTLVAALVTFLDGHWRRFYTTYHDASERWAKHSPGLSLIHEVVQESLASSLDCDLMTGNQPYKTRLATSQVPLYRVSATAEMLRDKLAALTPARVA